MKLLTKLLAIGCLLLLFTNTTCDDDAPSPNDCDFGVTIDNQLYNAITNEVFFGIEDVLIIDNCLQLTVSSSGCDGQSWEFELVDSGNVMESFPVQRALKLKFINNESCLAVFSRIVSFDLTDLQIPNENQIQLNIEGLEESVFYDY